MELDIMLVFPYGVCLTKCKGGLSDYTIYAKMLLGTLTIIKDGIDYPDCDLLNEKKVRF
jgi:hypothetical protein